MEILKQKMNLTPSLDRLKSLLSLKTNTELAEKLNMTLRATPPHLGFFI